MNYLLLLVGFGLLIKGADYFVEGSSRIAALLRISPLIIGLTIVAFGTSSPEAAVSIAAALKGSADVAVGNAVGSNIFMITLVIGLTAWILPLRVEHDTIRKEIPFTLLASVVLIVLISDVQLQAIPVNSLTRADGVIMLLFFSIFIYYIFEAARNNREQQPAPELSSGEAKWVKNILFTVGGLAAIIVGGNLVVRSATALALSFGMSETLVGLTIVAIGTSLPELITSITAAMKKQTEIALGNIVGSNIFNVLFVLGLAAIIYPLPIDGRIFIDIIIMIVLTLLLLVFSRTKYRIAKSEGIVLTAAYVIYLVYIIIRN